MCMVKIIKIWDNKQSIKFALSVFFLNVCTQGRTGFPWIDAIMIQLQQEGWIHHLARHAVGCFLTRGNLWISWEEGMKVIKFFEEIF